MFPFYTPENIKNLGFLVFSEGIKWGHWPNNRKIENYVVSGKMYKMFANYFARRSASISFTGFCLFDIRTAAKTTLG